MFNCVNIHFGRSFVCAKCHTWEVMLFMHKLLYTKK